MLAKGAIELVPLQERGQGCYSRYFLIPKVDGRLRPILDLRILNLFLKQEKFKMLTLAQVLLMLNEGDWMVSVDLQDAYFHVPIVKSHRKYLRFVVGSQHYQFAVLPFGLTSAPRVFTKVMAVVAAHLRKREVAVFPYLDDWLIKAKSPEIVLSHLRMTTQLLFDLGFSVNVPKSHLEPSQRLLFIGAVLDTTRFRAYPPPQRVRDIQALIPLFQRGAAVPVLKVLRLLGLFASCILLVTHAHWHMRALQWCLRRQWFQHKGDLRDSIKISRDAVADLHWWTVDSNLSQGKPFSLPPPVATVISDASTLGWEAHLGDLEIKSRWSPVEQMLHINLLELRAVRLALKAFLPSLRGQSVQILTDNTTTMWYINKQGGVGSYLLCREALRLWCWAQDHQICLMANHLAGVLNVRADVLSRHFSLDHEWRLHPDVVLHIFEMWGTPQVDLFATRENAHCPLFGSLQYPMQGALGDAFQMSWNGQLLYTFPPIRLIPRVLRKVRQDRAQVILVAPDWPRRVWYTDLLQLSQCPPLRLPLRADLLSQSQGQVLHPHLQSLHLHAWRLNRAT
ncbi:hypothetical protein NDU88_001967 [Pleurodeles waltl]|uniref:ribonuclease H n=1 Tax=Pleurodeles waltl TaxID=8319 RepID=A0AAV7QAB5_PLEWA|nr:hypothetical protein NDU88_001967 [Pleurodeles waltl]